VEDLLNISSETGIILWNLLSSFSSRF